jgi:hypothetical protein
MRARTRLWVLLAFVLLLATAGGIAYATIPGSDGVIHGCYTNRGGVLTVIDAAAGQTCSPLQTPITWNQQGPKGDPDPQGLPGPQGPPGVTRADERFFARSLADHGTWLPIVSGTWPDVRPVMTHVLTMHLEAGDYAVTAEMIADNDSGHGIVVCLFGNPTVGYTVAQSAVGNEAGFALQQTFEAQATYALDAPSDLELVLLQRAAERASRHAEDRLCRRDRDEAEPPLVHTGAVAAGRGRVSDSGARPYGRLFGVNPEVSGRTPGRARDASMTVKSSWARAREVGRGCGRGSA